MQTMLMKKTERQQFELFKQLIRKTDGMTTQDIMDYLNVSLYTVYRFEKQLSDNLSLVFENNSVFLYKENGYYHVFIDKSLSTSYVIDKIGLHYLKISQQFALLNALLYKSYPSAEALAQEINLSLSHTYKILKRINKALEPFNLSLPFQDRPYQTMLGNEKNSRIIMFYIYWTLYKGVEWPFYHSPKYFFDLPLPINADLLSPSQKTRLSYYQTFTYWQIIYKKTYVSLSEEFLAYLELFESISPVQFPETIQELLRKNQVTSEVIHEEEAYFGFLARFYIANIDSLENKIRIVDKLKASGLPLTNFALDFFNDFLKQFSIELSEENYVLVYYQIIFNLLYIQFFGINVPFTQTFSESFPYSEAEVDLFDERKAELINYVYENLSEKLFPSISKASSLVEYLAKILYLALNSASNQQKLKVFIQYSKTTYGYDLIKNKLATIFGNTLLEFTFEINDADIVISDSSENIASEEKQPVFFYFEYPYDKTSWQELVKLISQHLCSRLN